MTRSDKCSRPVHNKRLKPLHVALHEQSELADHASPLLVIPVTFRNVDTRSRKVATVLLCTAWLTFERVRTCSRREGGGDGSGGGGRAPGECCECGNDDKRHRGCVALCMQGTTDVDRTGNQKMWWSLFWKTSLARVARLYILASSCCPFRFGRLEISCTPQEYRTLRKFLHKNMF